MPRISQKFALYTFFSAFAALVNFGSRFLYDMIPGVHFLVAVTLAYLTGMVVNFISSKWLVFDSGQSGRTRREAVKFLFIAILGLFVTVIVSAIALWILKQSTMGQFLVKWITTSADFADPRPTIAHALGMLAGLLANFVGHEFLSFKETGIWDRILEYRNRSRSGDEQ
ncbi:MAG: GtrA family protein [Leptospiraceae bacterium]|nr:GtrA family protein [Leptospiraceae bacterium]